jgi:ATP-dependent protease ClpP protease subunit
MDVLRVQFATGENANKKEIEMPEQQDMPGAPQVRVKGNHIFFYDQIDQESAMTLNECLFDLERDGDWRNQQFGSCNNTILLHINSYGGGVFDALSVADTIRSLKSEVHTIIEGAAMSGATVISLAGTKRFMRKNATVLIHQARQGMGGELTSEQIKDLNTNNDLTEARLLEIYDENTSMDRKEILELLKHDLYLNSEQCLQKGIIDEII